MQNCHLSRCRRDRLHKCALLTSQLAVAPAARTQHVLPAPSSYTAAASPAHMQYKKESRAQKASTNSAHELAKCGCQGNTSRQYSSLHRSMQFAMRRQAHHPQRTSASVRRSERASASTQALPLSPPVLHPASPTTPGGGGIMRPRPATARIYSMAITTA